MSRISGDQLKTKEGKLISVECGEKYEGATLYNGYNYEKQCWIVNGERMKSAEEAWEKIKKSR